MRKGSASSAPRPKGWGFLLGLALVLGAFAMPAHAASTVTFNVSLGTDGTPPVISCALSVPDGANGIAVLDAAVAKKCIDSYHKIHYSFGDFITCINHICDLPWHEADQQTPADFAGPLYWELFVNGQSSHVGVSDYHVSSGDVIDFAFTTWVTCVPGPPVPCP